MLASLAELSANLDLLSFGFLLLSIAVFVFFALRARRGSRLPLRSIAGYARCKGLSAQIVESGRPVAMAWGGRGIGGSGSADASALSQIARAIAEPARTARRPLLSVARHGEVLATALGTSVRGQVLGLSKHKAREVGVFGGTSPLAHAAAVRQALAQQDVVACVVAGHLEDEALWIADAALRRGLAPTAATLSVTGAALLYGSVQDLIFGEDVYAAGPYMWRGRRLASLASEDTIRIVTILSIIVGVVLATTGQWI